MSDSCWVRTHALADWGLQPPPETTRPNCLASLRSGTIRPATCGRRALRFCFMISQELAMLLSGYSANALAGQARMASTRAGDRNRATSLEGSRDAPTLHVLLLCLKSLLRQRRVQPGKSRPPELIHRWPNLMNQV